ncbi:MAG: hypothetical protein KJP00_09410 [Bacteroidia bacterium]|nr:hypothetical protein [Bacteroidia bacterium]
MFIGETFFPPEPASSEPLSTIDILQLLSFGIVMIGLGIAWKWELTGGIIALIGFAFMATLNSNVLDFSLLLLYPATAILFIGLWAVSRRNK